MAQVTRDDETQKWRELLQLMQSHFNLEELHSLCFELGVDYDLLGEKLGLRERIIRLLEYLRRHGRLADLLLALRQHRPAVSWPDIDPDWRLPADLQLPPEKGGPNYQFGDIKAAQVNVGGSQVFQGAISIDMRETDSSSKPGESSESQVRADMDADLAARLSQVAETLFTAPQFEEEDRQSFRDLIYELSQELGQLPSVLLTEIENIVKRVESLSRELRAEPPDPEMVQIMGESLRRAADKIASSSPTIPALVARILALAQTVTS